MQFVTNQVELTTAATDAALALLALASAGFLYRFRGWDFWKILLWCLIMLLLATGSLFGVLVHGFKLATIIYDAFWFLIYLSLGLAVALFVVNAIGDGWGRSASRWTLPFLLVAGCVFPIVAQLIVRDFLIFILYEGVGMIFVLVVYTWLMIARHAPGAILITCGILVTIIAAVVQTIHSIAFTVIWQFNNNGLFHLIQMIGVVCLVVGIRRAVLLAGKVGKPSIVQFSM